MKTTVLLVNLGTPDSPSIKDVRKYLTEFLNDERVIDINFLARFFLVNGIIVPFRAPKSAKLYKQIFTDKGSPLLFHSLELKNKLQNILGSDFIVELAMRYQNPSLIDVLEKIKFNGTHQLIIVPLYPQYASSSTGSTLEKIFSILGKWQTLPRIKVIQQFYDDDGFINAFVENAQQFNFKNFEHTIFSFHGLPERQILKGNCNNRCLKEDCCSEITTENYSCYRASCFETARKIAGKLNLKPQQYTISFQSRLGKTPWIKPFTDEIVKELAVKGVKNVLCFSPAFVADCLETIYEIGREYQVLFESLGGNKIQLVPSLNSNDTWVEALKNIIVKN